MKKIKLTKGYYTKVDDDDYIKFGNLGWFIALNRNKNTFYPRAVRAVQKDGKRINIYLSREIMNCPENMVVDHINGDTLDNRKCNLRVCTKKENVWNHKKFNTNTSGYTGVYYDKRTHSLHWFSKVYFNGKTTLIGYFETAKKAHIARKVYIVTKFGKEIKTGDIPVQTNL